MPCPPDEAEAQPQDGADRKGAGPQAASRLVPRRRLAIRPHYFGLKTIDDDDRELRRATAADQVPPRCRLGGAILGPILARQEDPCAICPGNRDECGGRDLHDEDPDLARAMKTTWRTLEEGAIAGRKIERLFKNELIKHFIKQGEKEEEDAKS